MRLVLWMLSALLRIFGVISAVQRCYWYIGVVRSSILAMVLLELHIRTD